MRIAILVEGATEKAFKLILLDFLKLRLQQQMPKLQFIPDDGRIPKEEKLRRKVENLLTGRDAFDAVIALTDVYTGTNDFQDAADAKAKMKTWVGNNPNFYPHAAQYDFEAWLLPYWSTIQKLAGHNKSAPGGLPEQVNHNKSPSYHIKEIFELGKKRSYSKTRDAAKILKNNNLMDAVNLCLELKAFINTILSLCEVDLIP
ncbi:DUF4276 family protein [Nostoc commune]|uniref:DUF4276 family protein n=1 Tax=Nostoc commune TaxID=1178 RepID=UPI0018C48A7C|nr:DUF4276 family protein [Nostoc commune]MBG1257928.1 DUF4276 family protein [Nostoc commune BAE]